MSTGRADEPPRVPTAPATQVRRPTMRDVAALAGVAHKTVSRVYAGTSTVDPALVERVHRAAGQLGYRPNLAADLRSGQSNMIGLLVADVGNPFFAEVHRAVEDALRPHGKLVVTASLRDDPERERELIYRLIDRRVDGLIVTTATNDHRYLVAEQERGTPLVFLDRTPEPLVADAVVTDHRVAACRAVTHLLATGRRTVAFLGDEPTIQTVQDRRLGFLDALAGAGLPAPPPDWVRPGLMSAALAEAAVVDLLDRPDPPEALFTSQNLVTIGAVRALHRTGRQHDIALIGFDDVPFADSLEPAVTVVAQDTARLGALAAERLVARMAGDTSPAEIFQVQANLVVRGSGELPAAG